MNKKTSIVIVAIVLAVLLLPLCSRAQSTMQQTISYTIETTSRVDSFFLVETITQATTSSPRPSVQVNYYPMRDTASLSNLSARLLQDAVEAENRAAEQTAKAQLARAQAASIEAAKTQAFISVKRVTDQPGQGPAELKKITPKSKKKH
jgi:predicted outer membrane protein